jgi:hypothetical protein
MRFAYAAVLLVAITFAAAAHAQTSSSADTDASKKLTSYFHTHRLPMVGAQVSNSDSGRQVVLYGFVASDFGKRDAETKARHFMHGPISIVNRIVVDPSVRKRMGSAQQSSSRADSDDVIPNAPKRAPWEDQMDDLLRKGNAEPSNDPNLMNPND